MIQYESELANQAQNRMVLNQYASQMVGQSQKQNLIEYELDFSQELVEIARLLRCDIIKLDDQGNEYYAPNPDRSKVFLNDLGVNDILRKIKLLVNKGKILSNYTIEEIKERVRIIGHEIRAVIYNNYEQYEIDNEYKMNNYSMMVLSILFVVEDAYRRALAGETHKGLNEQRIVTQSESVNPQMPYPMMMQGSKKSSWLKPWSWGN